MKGINNKELSGPRRLSIVRFGNVRHFVDLRLRQFRDIANAYNFVDFRSDAGLQMVQACMLLECFQCGYTAVVVRNTTVDGTGCGQCGRRIPVPKDRWIPPDNIWVASPPPSNLATRAGGGFENDRN